MAKHIRLNWVNPNPNTNLDHLEIWRKTGSAGTYEKIGTNITVITSGTPGEYLDTNSGAGLADGQQYFYQVRAYNASGTFVFVEANVTISGLLIAPPTLFAAGTPTSTTIPLTWVKSTDGVMTQYRIYDDNVLIKTFVGDVAAGTLTNLTPATNYTNLSVRAFNGTSESDNSNLISVITDTDSVAPTDIYGFIPNARPNTIDVVFSEPVSTNQISLSAITRAGTNNPTGSVVSVLGDGTNKLSFTFASNFIPQNELVQILFGAGHGIRDLAGNLFAPSAPLFVINMIQGTGLELAPLGAHSDAGETNSIASVGTTSAFATVETVDVYEGAFALRATPSAVNAAATRANLAVNVVNTKNYKTTFWYKKVGGTNGTCPALDGSSSPVPATLLVNAGWRPASVLNKTPATSTTSSLRINIAAANVSTTTEYLLVDKLTFREY